MKNKLRCSKNTKETFKAMKTMKKPFRKDQNYEKRKN